VGDGDPAAPRSDVAFHTADPSGVVLPDGEGEIEMQNEDRWRIWRVTEPEPKYLRSVARRRRPDVWRDLPVRRWWNV